MICALGIVSIALASPAAARAQETSGPGTARQAAVGQPTDTTQAEKGPLPANQFDVMAGRRAGSQNAVRGSAASAPAVPPQAPVKVKPQKN